MRDVELRRSRRPRSRARGQRPRSSLRARPRSRRSAGPLTAAIETRSRGPAIASRRVRLARSRPRPCSRSRGSACISRPRVGDEPQRVFERKHAGHAGGGELAHAVADHERGLHAPGAPQRGERQLQGDESGCVQRGLLERRRRRGLRRCSSSATREPPSSAPQHVVAAVELGAEDGLRCRRARGPCPAYWLPWPVNRKATAGRALAASALHDRRCVRRPAPSRELLHRILAPPAPTTASAVLEVRAAGGRRCGRRRPGRWLRPARAALR